MADKMFFNRSVKYNGRKYRPNEEFEVLAKDVEGLRAVGGFIVEAPSVEEELEALKKEAGKLGIEIKGTWGVKKLREEIDRVEEELRNPPTPVPAKEKLKE